MPNNRPTDAEMKAIRDRVAWGDVARNGTPSEQLGAGMEEAIHAIRDRRKLLAEVEALQQERDAAGHRAVVKFYDEVCRRADANMQKTGRVEGAHYAAMQAELAASYGPLSQSARREAEQRSVCAREILARWAAHGWGRVEINDNFRVEPISGDLLNGMDIDSYEAIHAVFESLRLGHKYE